MAQLNRQTRNYSKMEWMDGWMDGPSTWPDSEWTAVLLWALLPTKRYNVAHRCQLNIHVIFAKESTSSSPKSENDYKMLFFSVIWQAATWLRDHQMTGQATCNSWNAHNPRMYSVLRIPVLLSDQGTSYFLLTCSGGHVSLLPQTLPSSVTKDNPVQGRD